MAQKPLAGTVNWPTHDFDEEGGYRSTGEGGQMVYAVWGFLNTPSCVNDVFLDTSEVLVSAEGPMADAILAHQNNTVSAQNRGNYDDSQWGFLVTSCVLIGSTSESLFDDNRGSYFGVTRKDLLPDGEAMVSILEKLYDAEATLVTFLDT